MVLVIHWHESAMDTHVFPIPIPPTPPSPPDPSGSSQCTSPEHLSHASNLGWWSVSPLIVYLFQCCSLRTSHPRLLPQSLKVRSVHLCLFFCFAYRVIVTIFLNPIYIYVSKLYWSLSFWLTSLCIMRSSFIHLIRTDSNEFFLMAVIFHSVYVPQLPHPFICWWASRLLPCPGYYKQCCDEHWGARDSFRSGFLSVYAQKWNC